MSLGFTVGRIDLVRLVEQAQRLEDFEEAIAAAARDLPADAGSILNFFDVPSGDAFDVAPEKAIDYFKAKGLKPTFSYADMLDYQHDNAFTVAKMMNVDMLGQVRASLDSALANGTTFKEWTDSITPILQSGGWWGRKAVIDPLSGQEVVAQLGSPWRLETIFRTNMQTAYAAGAWQEIEAQKDLAPFLMYDAVDDFRTRPLHASWDRKVLAADSDWWKTHYPPNGYNCRCGVIQLSQEEVDALGLKVQVDPPDDGTFTWTNPRTGEKVEVPRGLDPGFEHNAGVLQAMKAKLAKMAAEKTATLANDMQAAAQKAAAEQQAKLAQSLNDATLAAKKAQAEVASAAAKAQLARAQALAAEKAKQWVAQQQIDLIAKGKESAGAGAAFKIKALAELKKGLGWPELKPVDQLAQIEDLAAQFKAKQVLSANLSNYKKAVLAGKTPPPAAVKALKSLPDADAQAFLGKIDTELKAAQAAQAAAAAKAAEEAAQQAKATAKPSPAAAMVDGNPPNPAALVQYARKTKGGQDGAFFQDTDTGKKYLVKFLASDDEVLNEVLASKLYRLAGVDAPDLHAITMNGRPALASAVVDGIQEVGAAVLAKTPSVTEAFAVDAWLANWDVAGMSFDNTVLVGGRALRIDVGGSLRYRALGGLKGSAFGRSVGEIDSLRDGTNRQTQAVFGGMSKADIERSAEKVLAVSDDDIRAIVMRYGPPDMAERAELADLMIARKADLAQRFPAAAERVRVRQGQDVPTAAAARVTATEQQAVEASRVNGYGFATDSDQIEDNMVVVHAFKRANDTDATRGFFKLLPGASRDLAARILPAAGVAPTVFIAEARQSILDAVKSINFRAGKGEALDAKVVGRIENMQATVGRTLAEIDAAIAKAANPRPLQDQRQVLEAWAARVAGFLDDAKAGRKATMIPGQFPDKSIPDALDYTPKAQPSAPAGPRWKKVAGTYTFDTADFERSFAKLNGGKASVSGTSLRYEAELPDGTRIVYFPHDSGVAYAMQGVVKIDVPGKGVDATTRVFSAIDEIGIKGTRASEIDRQHLYLNAFARLRLIGDKVPAKVKAEFDAVTDRWPDGVRKKLEILKAITGVDVAASEGWRQIDGVRQAFGHGRAYQLRPDLDDAVMRELDKTHVLYHNPNNLGLDAGSGVFEKVKVIIDGGGMFASLVDRVRRGVPLAGSSVSRDLQTGGGSYHFNRIRPRADQDGTGIYWSTSQLRRMDAITYRSDQFGETTPGHLESNRLGQTVDDFKRVAPHSGNETIFKHGQSVFDGDARIVLASAAEVKDAIAWMQSRGYKTWPDGRALSDVIITKAKHRAKP